MRFPEIGEMPLGDGFCLRRLTIADAPAVETGVGDWEVARMLTQVPFPYLPGAGDGWIEMSLARFANGRALDLAVADEQGCAVGVVSFSPWDGVPFLGYWLARELWGRGLMTRAAGRAVALAFELGATSIDSAVLHDNPASLCVQMKLGFEIAGERRIYALSRKSEVRLLVTRLDREPLRKSA